MSKYTLRKHTGNFTTIPNNIIEALADDLPALGFYLYIVSLPDNWEFYKTFLCKKCLIGIKKLEKILKKLGSLGLVQSGQKRDENGRFSGFYLDIHDFNSLKINKLENKLKQVQDVQPEGQNCRSVKTVGRSGEAINKTINKKEKRKENKDILRSSDDEHSFFEYFWNIYPRKQKRMTTKTLWDKLGCNGSFHLILNNLQHRIEHEWRFKEKEHIPLPDTYLRQERWKDELIYVSSNKKIHPITSSIKELKENSPEFKNFLLSY